MERPAPTRTDHAFTLVEIVVATIVGLLVAAMIFTLLQRGMENADDAVAGGQIARETAVIGETLANDVRGTRAPGRDEVDDPLELADILRQPAIGPASDVVAAGPDDLKLRTRARATTATSCVWWHRDTASGVLTRSIFPDLGCGGAATRTDRMGTIPTSPTAIQPGVPSLFVYGILRDDDPTSDDPARCTVVQSSAPAGPPGFASIVSIGASIDLLGREGTRARRQASVDMTGIRSRDERDYRYALGCAW